MNVVRNDGDETVRPPFLPVGVRPAQLRQVSSPQRRHVSLFLLVRVTRLAESSTPTLVSLVDGIHTRHWIVYLLDVEYVEYLEPG